MKQYSFGALSVALSLFVFSFASEVEASFCTDRIGRFLGRYSNSDPVGRGYPKLQIGGTERMIDLGWRFQGDSNPDIQVVAYNRGWQRYTDRIRNRRGPVFAMARAFLKSNGTLVIEIKQKAYRWYPFYTDRLRYDIDVAEGERGKNLVVKISGRTYVLIPETPVTINFSSSNYQF